MKLVLYYFETELDMAKRYIDYNTLLKTKTVADSYSCVKQIWENGNEWSGFSVVPRPRSGFSLFVSDVTAYYTFPKKETVIAKKGDLIYIPSGEIYNVRFVGGGSDPDLFTLNFKLFDRDGNELVFAEGLSVYRNAVTHLLCDNARKLSDAFVLEASELKIQALFYELMFEICNHLMEKKQEYCPIRVGIDSLCAQWNQNKRIGEYANICGISEGAFYTYFKKWCGRSPVEYRNSIRINAARSFLANTDLSISEIAFRCGFEDPYYFSRIFKRISGVSPREYRLRWNKGDMA